MTYETPAAMRAALEARLRNRAHATGVDLRRLRRLSAFERILVRLEEANPGLWVLKGALAMEIRMGDRARTTRDLDLAIRGEALSGEAVRDLLIGSLATDPDADGFRFAVSAPRALAIDTAGTPGWRFSVQASLAGREFATVRIDVVARGSDVAGTERLPLPGTFSFAGFPTRDVVVIGREQHFAEKLHALTRSYGDRPNTRVRDLADLMLFIEDGFSDLATLRRATEQVFGARATHDLPEEIPGPPAAWDPIYAKLAAELDIRARSLEQAMTCLREFWGATLATA